MARQKSKLLPTSEKSRVQTIEGGGFAVMLQNGRNSPAMARPIDCRAPCPRSGIPHKHPKPHVESWATGWPKSPHDGMIPFLAVRSILLPGSRRCQAMVTWF